METRQWRVVNQGKRSETGSRRVVDQISCLKQEL